MFSGLAQAIIRLFWYSGGYSQHLRYRETRTLEDYEKNAAQSDFASRYSLGSGEKRSLLGALIHFPTFAHDARAVMDRG